MHSERGSLFQTNVANWSARRDSLQMHPRYCQEPACTMFLIQRSSHCHSSQCSLASNVAFFRLMQKLVALCSRTKLWFRKVRKVSQNIFIDVYYLRMEWKNKKGLDDFSSNLLSWKLDGPSPRYMQVLTE